VLGGGIGCHNDGMALLSPADQEKLREAFDEMSHRVRLLFFTQTFGCDTCLETRQILDELPPLSDKIGIEEVNLVLDKDKATQFGIDRAPAIAIVYEDADDPSAPPRDSRMRFLGAPSGYEFVSLVQAILLAGGRPSSLNEMSRQKLAAVTQPIAMQVFTTPT
jgi:alkyl hydroperoxide reductase subunit AhpF